MSEQEDRLRSKVGALTSAPSPVYFDLEAYTNSLDRLGSLGIRRLFSGHDFRWGSRGSIPLSRPEYLTRLIEDSLGAANQIQKTCRAGVGLTRKSLESLFQEARAVLDAWVSGRSSNASSAATLYGHFQETQS